MKREAVALEQAGAALMVLEMVPADLAGEITRALKVCATIGIGAGKDCDGQVLVLHDMLGVYPGKKGRFVKDFMAERASIDGAVNGLRQGRQGRQLPGPGAYMLLNLTMAPFPPSPFTRKSRLRGFPLVAPWGGP
jgi:3-methyl-2-oxobutanoate hydroxymethyltransferase